MLPYHGRLRCLFISSLILILGIIHLGVGIGITYHDRQYSVLQQQTSLASYNIFIGVYTLIFGIFAVITSLTQNQIFRVISAIAAFFMGVIVVASLITALVLSGQTNSYLREAISNNMEDYTSDTGSRTTVDKIQSDYDCCGVNLWLDWGQINLNGQAGGFGRRRRNLPWSPSALTRALRQTRQIITSETGLPYNLPSSYSILLPSSCCTAGGTFIGNTLGGYCRLYASNNTGSFYLSGCLAPIANLAFAQIVGIAVINTCGFILAFVCVVKLFMVIRQHPEPDDSSEKQAGASEANLEQYQQPVQQQQYQPSQPQQQQQLYHQSLQQFPPLQRPLQQRSSQQQYPYGQYYVNTASPNSYYRYRAPSYHTYL